MADTRDCTPQGLNARILEMQQTIKELKALVELLVDKVDTLELRGYNELEDGDY